MPFCVSKWCAKPLLEINKKQQNFARENIAFFLKRYFASFNVDCTILYGPISNFLRKALFYCKLHTPNTMLKYRQVIVP